MTRLATYLANYGRDGLVGLPIHEKIYIQANEVIAQARRVGSPVIPSSADCTLQVFSGILEIIEANKGS